MYKISIQYSNPFKRYGTETKSVTYGTGGDGTDGQTGRTDVRTAVILYAPPLKMAGAYKFSKGSLTYRADTKSMDYHCQILQREITPKVRKAELSFLYTTRCLVLFYISTKYLQNIPKGIQVTERTRSFKPVPTLTPMGSIPKTICVPPPLLPLVDI